MYAWNLFKKKMKQALRRQPVVFCLALNLFSISVLLVLLVKYADSFVVNFHLGLLFLNDCNFETRKEIKITNEVSEIRSFSIKLTN